MRVAGELGEKVWMIAEPEKLVELADPVVACPWFECVAIVSRRVASVRQCEVPGAADIAIAVELVVLVVHRLSFEKEFDCCAAA